MVRRRELTDEQKAAAEERRGKFRDLARQLAGMPAEARQALAGRLPGVATVEGHALSPHNTILLSFQRAGITLVGGFRQWRRAGRTVRRGEHGLMIWIPTMREQTSAAAATGGEEEQLPADTRPGFIMGTVFDVSQTEEWTP